MRRWILTLILIFLISGCVKQKSLREQAVESCLKLCQESLKEGINLEDGPCLSEEIVDDWVCDVSHFPRIEKDDFPQNQCGSYRVGGTHHFVEVDEECNLIRVY